MMNMKVAIIGMGYVGAVSAAAIAKRGMHVTGVECHPAKLASLAQGQSPIREPGLDTALQAARQAGLFEATDDLAAAVREADVVMIAVGTPSSASGDADMQAMDRVVAQLAQAVRQHPRPRVVMVRSTVPPGTTRQRIAPVLKQSCAATAVCHHPEFLREGSALADWLKPAMIVAGCSEEDRPQVQEVMDRLYAGIEAPRQWLATAESELLKYACNVFHAVKIDFANEIGAIARHCDADASKVMAALCQDTRLNISPAYLKPGFAFGGSCLPKDTRALGAMARQARLDLPLVDAVLASNEAHLARQVSRVLRQGRRRTLLLGLSFKNGTDDLRESPMVELAERLLGKGLPLAIFDADLSPHQLVGANARYVQDHLPHLKLLLADDLTAAAGEAQTIIIAKAVPGLESLDLAGKAVIDLTGRYPHLATDHEAAVPNVGRHAA